MSKEITNGQKARVWTFLVISVLSTWLTPLVAAWFLLVDPEIKETRGNGLFYFLAVIIITSAIIAFTRMLRKQKANLFKHFFLTIIGLAKFAIIITFFKIAALNVSKITTLFVIWSIGYLVGKLIHLVLVKRYKDYLVEVEVL